MAKATRLEALKEWRMRVKGKQLPFHVMPDHVLEAIVAANPKTLADLSVVPGMGPARMKKYGPSLISLLTRQS